MWRLVGDSLLSTLSSRFAAELGTDGWQLVLDLDDPDGQTLLFFYPTCFVVAQARYVRPVVRYCLDFQVLCSDL